MSKLLAIASVLLFGTPCIAQTTVDHSDITAVILKADKERNAAMVKVDLAIIDKTTADTYVFTDPNGRVTAKKELMDSFKSGAIKIESLSTSDVKVQMYGNVAVETGELVNKATRDGRDNSGTFRFTRVWVNRNGTWQTAALQETRVASQ
jgi:ketosteroid isomerase-like protein